MTERLRCLVPYCNRTRGRRKGEPPLDGDEDWICGKHWPLISYPTKAAWRLAKRRVRRIVAKRPEHRTWWRYPAGSPQRIAAYHMWKRYEQAWEKCKREAIERAAGI